MTATDGVVPTLAVEIIPLIEPHSYATVSKAFRLVLDMMQSGAIYDEFNPEGKEVK